MAEEKKEKAPKEVKDNKGKKPASLMARLASMPVVAAKAVVMAPVAVAKTVMGAGWYTWIMVAVAVGAAVFFYGDEIGKKVGLGLPSPVKLGLMASVAPAPAPSKPAPVRVVETKTLVVSVDAVRARFDAIEAKVDRCLEILERHDRRKPVK